MKIPDLNLYTSNLLIQKEFYTKSLGLKLTKNSPDSFSVLAGTSLLTFTESNLQGEPYYHFAFNIPENKLNEAIKWLRNEVELIEYEGSPVIDFPNWNSHSVYFYDPAGNIIELIARHNLKNASNEPFSGNSLLNISEIGMPVDSVKEFVELAESKLNENLWWGDRETFAAIGDEEGLFIAVTTKRNWFPTDKACNIYPMTVKIEKKDPSFEILEFIPYKIIPTTK
jgi:catechol-2,3-dioxygenase